MNMKRFLSIFFVLPLVFVSCDLTMDEVSQDVNKPGSGISAVAAAISTSSAAISSANTAV